jgi:hypothetical protein
MDRIQSISVAIRQDQLNWLDRHNESNSELIRQALDSYRDHGDINE